MSQKTDIPSEDELDRQWILFDASGVVLGRLATRVATILRGKHKRTFTPHLDCGDGAIVVNAGEVEITGKKEISEAVRKHSGYIGGLKEREYSDLLEDDPQQIIRAAVKGMLPKNRLGKTILKHLRIYAENDHPHQAQQPVEYDWDQDRIPK